MTGAQRIVTMQRIRNFRDAGGYATTEGRTVRRGVLYRSGNLCKATPRDLDTMERLGIRTVIDLRSEGEQHRKPATPTAHDRFAIVSLPILDRAKSPVFAETERRFREGDFDAFDVDDLMVGTNREFVVEWSAQFATFLRLIVEADGEPVLWHCASGKDRTGFAAALLLRLLGVDDETIVDDYLISRDHVSEGPSQIALVRLLRGRRAAEIVRELTTVQSAWIRAALTAIEAEWTDFDTYRRDALRIDDRDVDQLRSALLD